MYQEDERIQTRRRQTERAIQLAMANRWEDAAEVNKAIISLFPNDADSYNRLGKALMELERYNEAKKAYTKALDLDPTNQIARKNLSRLKVLAKTGAGQAATVQVDPTLFIEEMGKTAVTTLFDVPADALPKLNAGDKLELDVEGDKILVRTPGGEPLGTIEPKLRARLVKLIAGGNEYAAAVTSVTGDECKIIIKETFQHPSQTGRPSFPTAISAEGGLRPYTKESLLRYESQIDELEAPEEADEEDEDSPREGRSASWDSESVLQEGDVRLNDAAAAEDVTDDEIEE
jgi:tetratricopeptide (TPR) repeat protein